MSSSTPFSAPVSETAFPHDPERVAAEHEAGLGSHRGPRARGPAAGAEVGRPRDRPGGRRDGQHRGRSDQDDEVVPGCDGMVVDDGAPAREVLVDGGLVRGALHPARVGSRRTAPGRRWSAAWPARSGSSTRTTGPSDDPTTSRPDPSNAAAAFPVPLAVASTTPSWTRRDVTEPSLPATVTTTCRAGRWPAHPAGPVVTGPRSRVPVAISSTVRDLPAWIATRVPSSLTRTSGRGPWSVRRDRSKVRMTVSVVRLDQLGRAGVHDDDRRRGPRDGRTRDAGGAGTCR